MRKLAISVVLLGLGAMGAGGFAQAAMKNPRYEARLKVAAAADLRFALQELIRKFGEAEVQASYGASGNFLSQLLQNAPLDVFLSADTASIEKLISAGLADRADAFHYAVGRLAIWVPNSSPLNLNQLGMKALLDPQAKRIAIADPAHAPYGKAAEAALKKSEIFSQVKQKLVFGENVGQATQFVETGAAEVGIIALSLARAPELQRKGRYWIVPSKLYSEIDQAGVILKKTPVRTQAVAFRKFLLSPDAMEILEKYGFLPPKAKS